MTDGKLWQKVIADTSTAHRIENLEDVERWGNWVGKELLEGRVEPFKGWLDFKGTMPMPEGLGKALLWLIEGDGRQTDYMLNFHLRPDRKREENRLGAMQHTFERDTDIINFLFCEGAENRGFAKRAFHKASCEFGLSERRIRDIWGKPEMKEQRRLMRERLPKT